MVLGGQSIPLVDNFLRLFPALKYLQLGNEITQNRDPTKVLKALSCLHPTLETLVFSNLSGLLYDYSQPFIIRSLTGFHKLRKLTVNARSLIGTERIPQKSWNYLSKLPRSIESLKLEDISEWDSHILDGITTLLKNKEVHTPSLKFLDIGWERTKFPDKPISR